MATRKVLLTVVGHVDHGKTSLLDKIRQTAVIRGEAGGITQAIGVSIIPIETIQKICGTLLDAMKGNLTVPGLLAIDTPGHAAFTSLRKRGGSLADIAILIVDINEGFKPQTIESIEILKANKVPFIVAANKVDLIHGWQYDKNKLLLQNIQALNSNIQGDFEKKMYELVGKFSELGLQSERFDRVEDYTKQIAIVPVSAETGQGIPEILMVLTGLAQKFLEKKLEIEETGNCKGTILEVKEEKGLGTTLDAIIYNGQLKVNDQLVIGGIDQPIVVKVRALLEPAELAEMREKKSKFKNVKEVAAATGVKISAPGLDGAISGMPIRSCSSKEEVEALKQEVQEEVGEIMVECDECVGVIVKADTIGGLEALRNLLQEKEIPVSSASLGDISKKDLSKLESLQEKDQFSAVILGFNIKVPEEIEELAKAKKLKIINHNVIYRTIEEYEEYREKLKRTIEVENLAKLVRPCKFAVLKGYTFRQSNPAIVGVEIEIGQIKTGDPIMNMQGKQITSAKSMQEGKDNISLAQQGKQMAMSMDGVTLGRQVEEGDFLYTDIPENDFKKLKELKKHLSKMEIEVLKEVAEIKRKDNPVWGVG
ncbi:translation initiation factor IF-2 [Candidatus Woesearchaeota archaeon]|jgi:translation initiation factor 5B|nr:translation initiation factor IF-2 [Candidatus Woesearchaeota archaeon]MBT4336191.1 translation initiation factor IF-2 [Candidatus Woesearchaeota archaeon]MBT4468830.1 translation initiation factor IF-2 [Candidatus Woesearchaeota archaeon]MBT6744851.1 translation initiation factor IF-2 [Candidatus Woesearchaeota archaeon]